MSLTCRTCGQAFTLTTREEAGYKEFGFDPVPECFDCMQMHKLSFRNSHTLYRRKCDVTGETVISIYTQDAPFPVYRREVWLSDSWDPLAYGQDIDFSLPFFPQLRALQRKVPRMALLNVNAENSEYCNMSWGNKDSYCVFGGDYNDSVLYSILGMHNRSCVECDYSNRNELCYDVFNSFKCYGCRSIVDSKNCSDCAYVSDCMGCKDCLLCVNLKNMQYCIENEQLSREEYTKRKEQLLDGKASSHVRNIRRLRDLRSRRIAKFTHTISCENCSGDFMENSKDCTRCFFCTDSQDVTDSIFVTDARDGFLSSFFGHKCELMYQCMACVTSHRCTACFFSTDSTEAEYCDTIMNCQNVFGCVGLKHKRYCILNKQYTKEEYEHLRARLIGHMKNMGEWGEYLPKDMGCFAYNESTAMGFFPLSKDEAIKRGYRWKEQTGEQVQTKNVIPAAKLVAYFRQGIICQLPGEVHGDLSWVRNGPASFFCPHIGKLYIEILANLFLDEVYGYLFFSLDYHVF